jgi:hypothetical protein
MAGVEEAEERSRRRSRCGQLGRDWGHRREGSMVSTIDWDGLAFLYGFNFALLDKE